MYETLTSGSPTGSAFTLTEDTTLQVALVTPSTLANGRAVLQIDVDSADYENLPLELSRAPNESLQRWTLAAGTYRWKLIGAGTSDSAKIHTANVVAD